MKKMTFGLTAKEVEESREKYGSNCLTPHETESFWDKYWGNFDDPIIKILLVALFINVVFVLMGHGEWLETIGILVAVLLATFVAALSEYRNESTFQQLQDEASKITCKVWRDGTLQEIMIDDIVTGDAILLQSGDKIPVDGILLDGEVKVDQSTLNGESKEASKTPAGAEFDWDKDNVDFLDPYKLFRGTVVVSGEGVLQAVKIGDVSQYGQLTAELQGDDRESPLQVKLTDLAGKISQFGYIGAILIAVAVMVHKAVIFSGGFGAYFNLGAPGQAAVFLNDLVQAVILAVIIIVMAVPEGLPLMIAIVSSLNMSKMLKDNVLVRTIVGIETAGSLNILFSDKTGTITKGKLEVVRFADGRGEETRTIGEIPVFLRKMLTMNIIENSSAQIASENVIGGNATERALTLYVKENLVDYSVKRTHMVQFNSANKYSFAKVEGEFDGYLIKGAPEKLISRASQYYTDSGDKKPFTDEMKAELDRNIVEYSQQANRMLAFCSYEGAIEGEELPETGLIFLGVVGIRDEVRPEAVTAIAEVGRAGIHVVMVTGDRKETALAIARDVGLVKTGKDVVISSDEMAAMSDDELKAVMPDLRVVARALPIDKSRLVRVCQELNLVVGMTGDGVNDSPALKKADVGFAMNSGTEVAKEAGDIVLLDDNFRSIEKAILYGRTIYNSIRKFIMFQLTINVSAVLINFAAPFIGIESPLTIIQILWINLVMDTLAAIAFGGEPPLFKYMEEKPKQRDENIVSPPMFSSILTNGLYMTALSLLFFLHPVFRKFFDMAPGQKLDPSEPGQLSLYTAFFTLYILMAVFNGFNVRTETFNLAEGLSKNKNFLYIMGLILAVQFIMTYFGGKVLRTVPLNGEQWLLIVLLALTIVPVDLLRKLITGKKKS